MKNLVRVSSFIFALLLFTNLFTSCKKDGVDPAPDVKTNTTTPTTSTPSSNVAKVMALQTEGVLNTDSTDYCDCFDLFDEVDWDASEVEIMAQLETVLAGLTEEELIALFTPVCTLDGEIFINACVATCNGVTDFEACDDFDGEVDWNECFSFVYPLTVILPDGSNVETNNDDDLITAIDNYYDANPNSEEDPTLAYPVNVVLAQDGSTVAINNDDELEDLFEACEEIDEEYCFTINWPLTIVFPDGSTAEVNSVDEGEDVVDAWYDANPDVNEDVQIVFPIQVTLQDGTVQTINSEDELDTLIDACDGNWEGGCLVAQDAPNALLVEIKKMTNTQ